MTVLADGPRRRQDEVVDALAKLTAGLRPGDRLPSETQIMARFGVSRAVARAAIDRLAGSHVVRRVQGRGTFVHRRLDIAVRGPETGEADAGAAPSFHAAVTAAGARPRTVLVGTGAGEPPTAAAGWAPSPACRIERLAFIDDEAAGVLEHWVRPGALPEPAVALRAYESLAGAFAAADVVPRCVMRRATTEAAPASVCRRLGLPARAECWLAEAACVDAAGRPLYYARGWARTDLVRLVFGAGG